MKGYLLLQFKIINRKMIDFGIPLLIGYTLIPFIFIFLSKSLFERAEYANYVYVFFALSFVSKLSETKRNDFLNSIFNKGEYKILRILENIIYCFPFTVFLMYQKQFLFSLILNLCALLIVMFNFGSNLNVTVPTPFGKKPFEFSVGFRNTFYVFPIAYFLTYISISIGNFNLGVFSMLVIGFTCFSYYSKVENEYFVWNYNLSPKEFLVEKVKTCLTFFILLNLPIIIALSVSFFKEIDILIVFLLLCNLYLIAIIFAKYSSFPNEMNMSQGILIVSSMLFPPIILIFIPLFYFQSIKKLNTILND